MSRTWPDHRRTIGTGRLRRHLDFHVHRPLPVLPVLVWDQQRDWRTGGDATAHSGEKLGAIRLDGHALTAPVPTLTAAKILRDVIEIYRETSGHAVDDGDQAAAV
jgi:hypothetical protein